MSTRRGFLQTSALAGAALVVRVAEAEGYFTDERLRVTLHTVRAESSAAEALADLLRGDDDVCTCATIAEANGRALLARDRDMDAILDGGFLKTKRWP